MLTCKHFCNLQQLSVSGRLLFHFASYMNTESPLKFQSRIPVCVTGASNVGKSALIVRFIQGKFYEFGEPTSEDRHYATMPFDNETHLLEILDTSGDQDTIRQFAEEWYSWARAFIIVYSITSRQSFKGIAKIKEKIDQVKGNVVFPTILVATFADEENLREVKSFEGEKVAKLFAWSFFETSSKTGMNVENVFKELVKQWCAVRTTLSRVSTNNETGRCKSTSRSSNGSRSTKDRTNDDKKRNFGAVQEEESMQSISKPFNVQQYVHVDHSLTWHHYDPDRSFELLQKMGEGSFGEVWKARHRGANIILAIKIIEIVNAATRKDIEKEIETLRKCKHANIVGYFGTCVKNSQLWILMEYCDSGSVKDLMTTCETTLNEQQIAYVCKWALKGLNYLHKQCIVHRDIKAANILLMNGQVKIADFGVSATLDTINNQSQDDKWNVMLVGTPGYMAPETIRRGHYDTKTDIWSLGITAIEMADGVPPRTNLRPGPPPTLQNPKNFSSEFNDFIKQCLTKKPSQRASAETLLLHPFIKNADRLDGTVLGNLTAKFKAICIERLKKATVACDNTVSRNSRQRLSSGASKIPLGVNRKKSLSESSAIAPLKKTISGAISNYKNINNTSNTNRKFTLSPNMLPTKNNDTSHEENDSDTVVVRTSCDSTSLSNESDGENNTVVIFTSDDKPQTEYPQTQSNNNNNNLAQLHEVEIRLSQQIKDTVEEAKKQMMQQFHAEMERLYQKFLNVLVARPTKI